MTLTLVEMGFLSHDAAAESALSSDVTQQRELIDSWGVYCLVNGGGSNQQEFSALTLIDTKNMESGACLDC